jgi:hypothetical protein
MSLNDAISKRFWKPERHSEVYDFVTNLNIIIQELKQERARIDSALSALEQLTPGIRKTTPRVQAAASNGPARNAALCLLLLAKPSATLSESDGQSKEKLSSQNSSGYLAASGSFRELADPLVFHACGDASRLENVNA